MIFSAQMNRLLAFFKNGKAADTNIYQPDDVAAAMSANEAAYAAGISAKHIASGAFRILPGALGMGWLEKSFRCSARSGNTCGGFIMTL